MQYKADIHRVNTQLVLYIGVLNEVGVWYRFYIVHLVCFSSFFVLFFCFFSTSSTLSTLKRVLLSSYTTNNV